MSIVSTDQEVIVEDSKSRKCVITSEDIDLLNYKVARGESISSSDSSGHLDLLLKPSEIDRLVRFTSQDDECTLLSSSCGVAKKPGFYLKQDMKTVSKIKTRKYQDESDCVLDTLLPRVPSRCRNNYSSHSLLRRNSSDSRNEDLGIHDGRESTHLQLDTEEEFSTDEVEKDLMDSSQDLFFNKNTQTANYGNSSSYKVKDDLLSDEWLCSLNPRVFCRKKDCQEPSSISDQTLMRKEPKLMNSVKLNSLNDLTLPFYRIQKKIVEREVEKDLRSLGFTNETEVNWNALYYPKRRDVLRLIHYRLCNHISPDIVIVLDDKEFFCHRILLQSYSEYFDDLKSGETTQRVDITNMGITENAFLTIYTWMLTVGQGGFQLLTKQNVLEVLLACQTLRIKDFENQCISFLENDEIFNEEMAYFLFQNAVELKMKAIQNLMAPRVRYFFLILVSSKDFIELPLETVTVFLQSDNIAVHCELEVFFAGVRWLRHSAAERRDFIGEVMSCVRFGLMTPLELVDLRNTDQVELTEIVTNSIVQRLIDEGLAMAVKNTLCKKDENDNNNYLLQIKTRNWLRKPRSYKTYHDFIEFLKEIKKNPKNILLPDIRSSCRSEIVEYPKISQKEYNLQISEKSGGSLTVPDSGIASKSQSKETKMNQTHMAHFRHIETYDVSTNTCLDYRMYNVSPTYIKDLIKTSSGISNDSQSVRRPESKVSEPVILTRASFKPSLRDQAATVIQAALRGHITRLKLLEALTLQPRLESSSNLEESNETVLPYSSPLESNRRSSSHLTISHLKSETKLQEELTNHGSTFHLFQNSILVFGGLDPTSNLGPGNSSCSVYRYKADKNKWEAFGNLPEPRYYHGVAMLKGRVYLAGGVDPKREDREERAVCKNVWSMDPNTGLWENEADMLTERKNFGLIAAGGYLYAIGGHNNESFVLASVERYDAMSKKWIYVASLENGRTGAAICKHNHMIWVAGGISAPVKHQVIKHVECYDPKRNVWMTKSPLRFGRAFGCLVSLRGSLYLVGGASKKSSTAATSTPAIDVWDERNKEWKLKTEMTIPRHNHSVAYVGSQMVILGGTTTLSMRCVTTVESWCVSRGTWIRGIASLPAPLIGHSTATLPLDVP